MEEEADSARADIADDRCRADIVFEHPKCVATDKWFCVWPHPVLESLNRICADRSEAFCDVGVEGFEGVAKKFSEITDTVDCEGDDACEWIGSDNDDGDQGPDQAWNCSDKIHHHSRAEDQPARSDILRTGGCQGK